MNTFYTALGFCSFWGTVTVVVALKVQDWIAGRKRARIESVMDPFTLRETSRIATHELNRRAKP